MSDSTFPPTEQQPDPSTDATVARDAPVFVARGIGWRRFGRRFLASRAAVLASVVIGLLVVMALFAPWIAPHDPNQQDLRSTFQGLSGDHLLGTDDYGRDQLSRLIYGARVSLLAALVAVGVGAGVGVPLGMLAGYRPGVVDVLLGRLNDALMSVPALIFALTVVAALGRGLTNAMLAVGIIFIPRFFRVARAATQDVRGEVFIEGTRSLGCTPARTLLRHVLPNVMLPLVVQISLMLGAAVTAEASLSFLGLGAPPPTSSWGAMLNAAAANVSRGPHLVYAPGAMIAVTVLAFTFIGDGVRDALSTRRISGE